ncbi:Cysteine-rich receptor-like protein kinase 26 [Triticum urartu]|uniref:Cysteine-rich receptor-like protein kinase 26 n=1 Tax=Triticum urartu TaxID=4572 RepID=M7ZNY9_TRIUA|nr:Cysteine-rich receptor-like protein kinase 26 [Triticum urartu]
MDRQAITSRSELEHILFDDSAEPKALPLSLLEHITSGFSDDNEIGDGGFARVYKGILDNGTVAVKKLSGMVDIDDKKFSKEVRCLMLAKHRNIVRFLGYCSDTQGEMMNYEGELVLADVRQRLLCFEYLSQGSLDKQITDTSHGLEWRKCYEIISGICDGLCYLHQKRIVHLDLKPANILLDDNMMPKIADFGLSRCFKENQSRIITLKLIGTLGYMPPEFYGGQITFKFDIYSLGIIIIEILTGEKGYPNIDKVLGRWRNKLEKTQGDTQLVQVRVCTEIAIECIDSDPAKRPDIQHIVNRLGETRSEVKSATETGASSSSSVPQQVTDRRETASDVEEALIIGRNEEKQKIVATLSGSITPEMTVLPIYGIGGIGKTTLAQIVFNASQFAGYSRVWVYVSQNLDLNKIGNSILSQLSEESHVAEKQMIHNKLRKVLAGKKILVVLDDVWEKNPDTLKSLKAMLRLGVGSMVTIIVTTRDEAIAREICHTVEPYKLGTLTDKFCWKIIKEKTSFKDRVDKKQMKHTGREIATKCGGVALAAQSLGYTLNGKSSDEWESLCEKYVTQLLGMSFLQYSKTPLSDGQKDKAVTLFTMHDLVHDLARAILADQVNDKGSTGGNRCRYALLTDCSKPLQSSVTCPANINALHFLGCGKLKLCGDAFSLATCLHVLDLSGCLIQKLPDSVSQLKQLRFLCAPKIQAKMIPSCITELSELNYLNLRDSYFSALPDSIGAMKGLMHLDLSRCEKINELPVSFTELKQLVHLDLSYCQVSVSEAFGGFTKLQYLNLSSPFIKDANRRGLSKVIGNLIKLRYLNLSGCVHLMAPSEYHIGIFLDSISTLSNLEHLDLSLNKVLFSIPESIGNLRKLHTLNLSCCYNLKKLPDSMVKMVSLKVVDVASCSKLDESALSRLNVASLPDFVVHASSDKCSSNITLLQHTNPDRLMIDRLENVMSPEEAKSIKLIEKQKISKLSFQWTRGAEMVVDEKEVLEKLVPPISVLTLSIKCYSSVSFPDWLMGMRQYLPNLCRLYLYDFPNCNKLPPLGKLPNLRSLIIDRMEGLEEWNTEYTSGDEGADELMFPKLRTLTIKQCLKLRIKPCLPRAIISLEIIDCDNMLSSKGESPSHLSHLSVYDSVVPMHEWRLLHDLPALRKLSIDNCSDLTTSSEIIQHLSSLESLCLHSLSLDQAELPSWLVELTSLHELSLFKYRSMTSLPHSLGELTSLEKLKIEHCERIKSLPDSIQKLTKLYILEIVGCPTLRKWCVSKENKMKIAHINKKLLPKTCMGGGLALHG